MYRDFGAEVTLVEFADRIVPLEDPEVGKELARVFKKRGIAIHTASTIDPESITKSEGDVELPDRHEGRRQAHRPDQRRHPGRGRAPAAHRRHRPRGHRRADAGSRLRRRRRVHAHRRRPPLRHRRHRSRLRPGARRQPRGGRSRWSTLPDTVRSRCRMDLMPRVTFCRPQIASVGMSEEEAKAEGREHQGRLVPVPRPRQGDDRGRDRRIRQARSPMRRPGSPARRAHHRAACRRSAGRAHAGAAGGGHGRQRSR